LVASFEGWTAREELHRNGFENPEWTWKDMRLGVALVWAQKEALV
jgi:hypothetical protein